MDIWIEKKYVKYKLSNDETWQLAMAAAHKVAYEFPPETTPDQKKAICALIQWTASRLLQGEKMDTPIIYDIVPLERR